MPAFEICKANIRMMSKGMEHLLNSIVKENVTAPEFMVLQIIHGETNVDVIEQTMTVDIKGKKPAAIAFAQETVGFDGKGRPQYQTRTHQEELDRLRNWYGPNPVMAAFPGDKPRLPYAFEDARIPLGIPDNVTEIADHLSAEDKQNKLAESVKGQSGG